MSYCRAARGHPFHGPYHDREYGFPVRSEAALLERLALEINQAGLSWLTMLKKRDHFRRAFAGFDPARVAAFGARDRRRLLADAGIIRNRLKVAAVIENARRLLAIRETHGSFAKWLDAHHPRTAKEWEKLFRKTFVFTGGEIVKSFLLEHGLPPRRARAELSGLPQGRGEETGVDDEGGAAPARARGVLKREGEGAGPAFDGFRPAGWLPGPHLQTVWGRLVRSRRQVPMRREILETPDRDDLVVDHVDGPAGSPQVIVLHGLEGSSNSVYAQGLLLEIRRRGWRGAAMNFRSCARDPEDLSRMLPNRRPRLYHSGETEDLDFLARTLASRDPATPLLAVGVSLGGNVLLKWLGESRGPRPIAAAVAISTPYDLAASGRYMETAIGRFYTGRFLVTLKTKAAEVRARFPEAAGKIDLQRALAARTFWEFDDAANAPLHGFAGADDYYRRASSLAYLSGIRTRTLCLSAEDDPFLPAEALERARRAAPAPVEFLATSRGGHIGFVSGPWRPRYWAEELAIDWLGRSIGAPGRH